MDIKNFQTDKRVKVDRTEANDHPGRGFSMGIQEKMGKTLCPPDFTYEATATVHVYTKVVKGVLSDTVDATFICVLNGFETVPEGMADAGFKVLQAEHMRMYGRKPPEFRQS